MDRNSVLKKKNQVNICSKNVFGFINKQKKRLVLISIGIECKEFSYVLFVYLTNSTNLNLNTFSTSLSYLLLFSSSTKRGRE